MAVYYFIFETGIEQEDGKKRSFFHAEESPRKPEGFRERSPQDDDLRSQPRERLLTILVNLTDRLSCDNLFLL